MLHALSAYCCEQEKHGASFFLSKEFAVLDWTRLGVLTGSRISEYGQSGKLRKGEPFSIVPRSEEAGQWAGQPIAFIRADFTYFDADQIRRLYDICLTHQTLASYFHCRFRFDKSVNNFTIRKFKRQSGNIICLIKASLSILRRADLLGMPLNYPIGAYRLRRGAPGDYTFISGADVQDVLQFACRLAYPNPNHYLRLHIHCLMSHSNRVTAAVALYNAGVKESVIAHKLRWSEESVKYYIRDCFKAIGPLTEKAVRGAFLN